MESLVSRHPGERGDVHALPGGLRGHVQGGCPLGDYVLWCTGDRAGTDPGPDLHLAPNGGRGLGFCHLTHPYVVEP